MARIHRISAPENDSETKAIRTLAELLPAHFLIFHNFELTTGRGLPYEYDMAIVGDFAVWHVEVKGYHGQIRGDRRFWQFENGFVQPSPIPLANKKSKILASTLKHQRRGLDRVWVDTTILLTDDHARVALRDEQARRVISLRDAKRYFTDVDSLPVAVEKIGGNREPIRRAITGDAKPGKKIRDIGLYDVVERINQTDSRTVFLAEHRYIETRPKTVLKVFHFDVYSSEEERQHQIRAIFHDQNAMRLLGAHPNLIETSDMFAWQDDSFVLPTEYVEGGRPLEVMLDKHEHEDLSWAQKADLVAQVARGMRHVHSRGVIHRDLRPLSVVVSPSGVGSERSVVKLVNFDLAKIEGQPELQPGDPTRLRERLDPRYAAPEVWNDPESASPASDIYSLGILFHELITGQRPYEHIGEVLNAEETPWDSELLLDALGQAGSEQFMNAPQDVEAVIRRMTAKDPARRYQAMGEIVEDLAILEEG